MCVTTGTLIQTPDGERLVESLRAGDPVVTSSCIESVSAVSRVGIQPVIRLTLANGRTLTVTADSQVKRGTSGWEPSRLQSGKVLDGMAGTVTVSSIAAVTEPAAVWSLATTDGTYFANGVLVKE